MTSFDATSNNVYLRYDTSRTDNLLIKAVVEVQLRECPQAILWCNDGLFGLIPIERVKNAVILRKEKSGVERLTPLSFSWSDVVVLNPSQLKLIGISASTGQKL